MRSHAARPDPGDRGRVLRWRDLQRRWPHSQAERDLLRGRSPSWILACHFWGGSEVAVEGLTAADVTRFACRECGRRSVASAKATVTGLRALLRFLYLDGQIITLLAGAVPSAFSPLNTL